MQIISELSLPAPNWGPASRTNQLEQLKKSTENSSGSTLPKEQERFQFQDELRLMRRLCAHLEHRKHDYDGDIPISTRFHVREEVVVDGTHYITDHTTW